MDRFHKSPGAINKWGPENAVYLVGRVANLSSIPDPKWDPETRNCTWKGQSRIGATTRSQWFFCLVQISSLQLPDGWKVRSLDGNGLVSESHPRSNSSSIKPPRPPILLGIIVIPQNPENQEFLITPYFPSLKITQSRGYTWPVLANPMTPILRGQIFWHLVYWKCGPYFP
jgi:hypothetical protein